ncbi:MAG: hypothetical protein ABIH78_05050 [Candidatus Peregrinibacteria bacterium]
MADKEQIPAQGNGPGSPSENPEQYTKTRADILEESRKRQKDEAEKAQRKLTEAIKDRQTEKPTNREDFVRSAVMENFRARIKRAEDAWKRARIKAGASSFTEDLGELQKRLNEATLPYEERMKETAEFAEAYIRKITESTGGKLTKEMVIKMRDSVASAGDVVVLLSSLENKGLVDALRWVLDMSHVEKGAEKSVSSGKGPAFEALLAELEKSPKLNNEKIPFVWMIMSMMKPVDKTELAKLHISKNNLDIQQAKFFLEEGNKMGVFGPQEMVEILEVSFKGASADITPERLERYAVTYKAQHDFVKEAKLLIPPYGSVNEAGEKLTLKNTLFFVAKLAAGATIGANIITSIYDSGEFKSPGAALKSIVTNHNIIGAGAVLGLTAAAEGKFKWKDLTEGKPEKDAEAQEAARHDLYDGINSNIGWKNFFELDSYAGAKALSKYIGRKSMFKKEKLRPEKLKVSEFIIWLKMESENPENAGYKKLVQALQETEKGYAVNGSRTENREFKAFAEAFLTLGIGGAETVTNYDNSIAQAAGLIPPVKPKIS